MSQLNRLRRLSVLWGSGFPALLIALTELALLAVVLVAFFAYQSAISQRVESRDAVEAMDNLLIALIDAETGERGYLITGEDEFLKPYRNGLSRISVHMEAVGAFAEDSGEPMSMQVYASLSDVVDQKVALMETSVALMAAGDDEAAREQIVLGRGRELMDQIRADITTIRTIDEELLASRSDRVDNIGRFIAVTAISLAALTLGIVGWLLVALRRRQETIALRAVADAKDEFVGFVSHELRTPIALVAGNVRMLEDAGFGEGDDAITEALAEISYAADRQQDIVNTLLSLAKAGGGSVLPVEPIMLTRIAQGVRRRHLRQHPDLRIEVHAEPGTPPALGDRSAVEQVLINLISNANKYGNRIEPIRIDVAPDGDHVRVSVTNSGELVDREAFQHIFEPFFRMPATAASAPGIGLGLTVCHRLIAAQGGQMSAEAVPTGGACFTFRLPVAPLDDERDV